MEIPLIKECRGGFEEVQSRASGKSKGAPHGGGAPSPVNLWRHQLARLFTSNVEANFLGRLFAIA